MRVLMCPPTFFDIKWEINPFMKKSHKPDPKKARLEWLTLLECYLQLGVEVKIIRPRPGLYDMVFTANAGWGRNGVFVLSKFRRKERRAEAEFYRQWFIRNNFKIIEMPNEIDEPPYFEGQGDLITTSECYLFGWGIRSSLEALEILKQSVFKNEKVIPLQLVDQTFYHLDTCLFSWETMDLIMYYPGAFAKEDIGKIRRLDLEKIEITREEALNLVCNGIYCGSAAILSGLSRPLLNNLEKRFRIFFVKRVEELASAFKNHHSYSHKGLASVIILPKPVELLKAGGSYRCCSLFLD